MSRIFAARYGGRCAADCGQRIEAGDDVQFIDGELMHSYPCAEHEADADRRMAKRAQACGSCFMVHAGECL